MEHVNTPHPLEIKIGRKNFIENKKEKKSFRIFTLFSLTSVSIRKTFCPSSFMRHSIFRSKMLRITVLISLDMDFRFAKQCHDNKSGRDFVPTTERFRKVICWHWNQRWDSEKRKVERFGVSVVIFSGRWGQKSTLLWHYVTPSKLSAHTHTHIHCGWFRFGAVINEIRFDQLSRRMCIAFDTHRPDNVYTSRKTFNLTFWRIIPRSPESTTSTQSHRVLKIKKKKKQSVNNDWVRANFLVFHRNAQN